MLKSGMVLKKLGDLEDPTQGVRTIKPRNLKFHTV